MSGLYGYWWQVRSKRFLAAHPLCIMCQRQGRTTAATIVDHIIPHKGSLTLFWDKANWQPLCKQHHDRTKQASTSMATALRSIRAQASIGTHGTRAIDDTRGGVKNLVRQRI